MCSACRAIARSAFALTDPAPCQSGGNSAIVSITAEISLVTGTTDLAEISFLTSKTAEILHPFCPSARWLNHVPSGPPPKVCDPHHHGRDNPRFQSIFATPLLPPTLVDNISLLTCPPALYPLGTGSSTIRPSIAANRCRFRCPSARSSHVLLDVGFIDGWLTCQRTPPRHLACRGP